MVIEKSERQAIYLVILSLMLVLAAGTYSLLLRQGITRLDLTGSMFFIFALTIATASIALVFHNARYTAVFAALSLFLAMTIFGTCVLGWRFLSLTC